MNCKYCGKRFGNKVKRKFCSCLCSNRYRAKKKKQFICKACGKTFYLRPSEIKKGQGKYCSKKCFDSVRITREKRKCLICAKEYFVKKTYLERGELHGSFCSKKCKGKYFQRQKMVVCQYCKKRFFTNKAREKRYCGNSCAKKSRNPSEIELKIMSELERQKIPYAFQSPIGRYWADFVLPNNLVIQCDGTYWHSLKKVKQRDKKSGSVMTSKGYKVLRLSEDEINKDSTRCINEIITAKKKKN